MTLKHVLVDADYNDLGFSVGNRLLILVESQSTWTFNIIIRALMYLMQTYHDYFRRTKQNLYGSKKVKMPKPELYVIFTGERKAIPDTITLSKDFFDEFIGEEESSLYVLSNRHNVKGAAVILYDGLLKEMSKVLGHDLLILPSSVHEVLVMAYDKTMDFLSIRDMVEHINEVEVPVCDVLSDQIYRYNREKDQVSFLIEDMES